ncbi:PIG-L family deacetylase [Roseomonas sp. SSH11]|uniref:PIG-L family deacetylase n=1 Tax=Pararoseomonas baculiformis TaxID=2820812 RepID=A0ABS4A9E4_9PROT|nr:PIG-L family deacetylase [Pararoseomonas baculiformis]MBP0443615.1 PIG-L family deacetylase [Pararoseomonas baculiformis]
MGREQGRARLSAGALLTRLARREPLEDPVAIVVAHPDDETLGAGGVMPLFRDLLLLQVTDGAPRNLEDARAAGFSTAEDYAEARERELQAALRVAGVAPGRVRLGAADQGASLNMPAIARAMAAHLARHGTRWVLTHAYEGGHPDHDATAFCVQAAAALLARGGGEAPAILEMPFYHAAPDGWAIGRFLPGPPHTVLQLTEGERARKRAMIDAFTTQAGVLGQFPLDNELFRQAPAHDFTAPPHEGQLLYERHGWGMGGQRWRALVAEASLALGLAV